MIEARGILIENFAQKRAEWVDKSARARLAAAEGGRLRECALPGCAANEAHVAHFKACSACKASVYCCREHQVAHWPQHKAACKAARKAAAATDAA